MRTSIHSGGTGNIRHSPRNGFTTYDALSPATNSSCHRRRRIDGPRARLGFSKTFVDLTPATGARTTRFCRTLRRRSSTRRVSLTSFHSPCDSHFRADAAASTASHLHVRDDRDTPLYGRGGMARGKHIFLKNGSHLFLLRGLDRNSRELGDLPVGQRDWSGACVRGPCIII